MKKTSFAMVLLFVMIYTSVMFSTSVLAQTAINASEIEAKYGIKGCNDANCKIIDGTLFLNGGGDVTFTVSLMKHKTIITGNNKINGQKFDGEFEIEETGKFRVKNGGIGDVKGIENAVCTESPECAIGKEGGKVEGLDFAAVEGLKKEGNKLTGTCQEGCKLPGGATFVEGSAGKEFTITLGTGEGDINTLEVKGCDITHPCSLQMTDTTDSTPIRLKTKPGEPIDIITTDGGKLRLDSGEIIYDASKRKWYVPASAVPNTIVNGVTFNQNVPSDITLISTNKNSPTYTSKGEMSAEFYANGVSVVNNVDNSLFTVNLNPSGKGNIFGTFIVDPADTFKLSAYNGGRVYIDGSKEIPDVNMQGHALVTNDKTQIMFENGKVYGTPYDEGGNSVASKIRFLDANNQPLNIGGEEWYVTFGNVDFEQCAKELAAVGVPGAPEADVCGVVTGYPKEMIDSLNDLIPLSVHTFYAGGCFNNKEQAPQPKATSFLSFVGRAWGWVTGKIVTLTDVFKICSSCYNSALRSREARWAGKGDEVKICNSRYVGYTKTEDCIAKTDYLNIFDKYSNLYEEWKKVESACLSGRKDENYCKGLLNKAGDAQRNFERVQQWVDGGYFEGQAPPTTGGGSYVEAAPRPEGALYDQPSFETNKNIVCDWTTNNGRQGYMCRKVGDFSNSYDDYFYVYDESKGWTLFYDYTEIFIIEEKEQTINCGASEKVSKTNCVPK